MRITTFLRSRALLRNYLARAQSIAAAGDGNLWLIEPTLAPYQMPAFAHAVARHLADHGVVTRDVIVLEGPTSARIGVLAAPTLEIVLPQHHVTRPTSRR